MSDKQYDRAMLILICVLVTLLVGMVAMAAYVEFHPREDTYTVTIYSEGN